MRIWESRFQDQEENRRINYGWGDLLYEFPAKTRLTVYRPLDMLQCYRAQNRRRPSVGRRWENEIWQVVLSLGIIFLIKNAQPSAQSAECPNEGFRPPHMTISFFKHHWDEPNFVVGFRVAERSPLRRTQSRPLPNQRCTSLWEVESCSIRDLSHVAPSTCVWQGTADGRFVHGSHTRCACEPMHHGHGAIAPCAWCTSEDACCAPCTWCTGMCISCSCTRRHRFVMYTSVCLHMNIVEHMITVSIWCTSQ